MRAITRTINTTKIDVAKFEAGNLIPVAPVFAAGEIKDNDRQMKAVRAVYGKNANVIITGYDVISEKRAISYEDFMSFSHVVAADEEEEVIALQG